MSSFKRISLFIFSLVKDSQLKQVAFSEEKLVAIRRTLLDWFQVNGRHWIPWKLKANGTPAASGESIDPYPIWIAEVMLQQTQLKTVLPYWEKWMKTFPTLLDLANAHEQDLLLIWQGLGYYSRVRRLHQASKILLDLLGAKQSLNPKEWPRDLDIWMTLPGIGRSTAGSIISSAFDLPSPILDGNVKRIFARLLANKTSISTGEKIYWYFSEQLLDSKYPRNFNQALMDLGATLCKAKKPSCELCPLKKQCIAYSMKEQLLFPVKDQPKKRMLENIGIGVVLNDLNEVLIDQRLNQGLLGGMWEFPGGKQKIGEDIKMTIIRELKEELAIEVKVGKELIAFEHSYSHKNLHFVVHICELVVGDPKPLASQQVRWVAIEDLSKYPFPSANGRMIFALKQYLNQDKCLNGS